MTRTERLQLYRWVPEDFVDLEQINENFTLLDTVGGDYNTAAQTLRYNAAHDALQRYHTDTCALRRKNLLLADFSKQAGQTQTLHQLQMVYGCPMLIPNIAESTVCTPRVSAIHPGDCEVTSTFTVNGYGQVESVVFTSCNFKNEHTVVSICEDGKVMASSEVLPFLPAGPNVFPVSCDVAPGHTYQISVMRVDPNGTMDWYVEGDITVNFSGTLYESGWFTTVPQAFENGSVLDCWVYYCGGAPEVHYSLDGGAFLPTEICADEQSVRSDGSVCRRLHFCLENAANHTLQLQFILTHTDTLLQECCAILL